MGLGLKPKQIVPKFGVVKSSSTVLLVKLTSGQTKYLIDEIMKKLFEHFLVWSGAFEIFFSKRDYRLYMPTQGRTVRN